MLLACLVDECGEECGVRGATSFASIAAAFGEERAEPGEISRRSPHRDVFLVGIREVQAEAALAAPLIAISLELRGRGGEGSECARLEAREDEDGCRLLLRAVLVVEPHRGCKDAVGDEG